MIAAGAVYLAGLLVEGVRHVATQKNVVKAAGLTEISVRNKCRELAKKLKSKLSD